MLRMIEYCPHTNKRKLWRRTMNEINFSLVMRGITKEFPGVKRWMSRFFCRERQGFGIAEQTGQANLLMK